MLIHLHIDERLFIHLVVDFVPRYQYKTSKIYYTYRVEGKLFQEACKYIIGLSHVDIYIYIYSDIFV